MQNGKGYYSARVACVTQFVKNMKTVLKCTRIALQFGTIAARYGNHAHHMT